MQKNMEQPLKTESALQKSLEFQTRLNHIYRRIHEAGSFLQILPEIEREILGLLQAERMTIYQRGRHEKEIVSRHKTGSDIHEIRLPLSTTSLAGFTALTQQPVRIDDVYDENELAAIHPDLKFDSRFDKRTGYRTRSMVVVPIKSGDILLGILQIINRTMGAFSDEDLRNAQELARALGQKFRYDLNSTQGPFDYLVLTRQITQAKLDQLHQQAAVQKCFVTQLLTTEAGIPPDEVGASLEHYYQVPYMRYDPDLELPGFLLKRLNEAYLRAHRWVPVAYDQDKVVVLIDDPSDVNRIMEIQKTLSARTYQFRVGLPEDILRFLGVGIEVPEPGVNLEELVGRLEDNGLVADDSDISIASAVNENEATVVQIVNRLIIDGERLGASDIHIEPGKGKQPAAVRMRIDGACRSILKIPASHTRAVVARIKVMARLDISERRKPQDGKFAVRLRGKSIELRVATVPTVNGEGAVLRLLQSGGALPMEALNLSERVEKETRDLVSRPHGIFLVVGPTGSGKTTTLHALLGFINTPERKIWTAEDPVEITQPGLQQVQVDPKIGFTFASALRSFLRADPDVILIGEIRDAETAHSAIEASLTGHLVFSTLHTNSAPETITRLLDLGLDPMNFADSLLGVLAQRLVRTLCPGCKQPYLPSEHETALLEQAYGGPALFQELGIDKAAIHLYKGKGCDKCGGTGYRGRTGIHELITATPEMKTMIARRAPITDIRKLAFDQGMRSLIQDGIGKLLQGQTDFQQLRKVTA